MPHLLKVKWINDRKIKQLCSAVGSRQCTIAQVLRGSDAQGFCVSNDRDYGCRVQGRGAPSSAWKLSRPSKVCRRALGGSHCSRPTSSAASAWLRGMAPLRSTGRRIFRLLSPAR